MPHVMIPNGYFQLWLLYVQQYFDYRQLAEFADERDQLEKILALAIDTQSDYTFFVHVVEKTQNYLQCPALIFELAKLIRPEHFGVLGYMATRSESVADALDYVMRFSRLVIDGEEFSQIQLKQQQQEIHMTWPWVDERYALLNEMTMACMVHLARYIFPLQHFHLLAVEFAHPIQRAAYHYQKFFQCDALFNQPHYAFVLNLESLAVKSELADPSLMQLLLRQAESAIAAKPQSENVLQQSQQWIADYLRQYQQAPKIDWLAQQMHRSSRTLQRQLQQAGHSFSSLIDIERIKRCEQLLEQDEALFQIAAQLGYSDQSALARAYKAHTGQTLLQRKKQLKNESSIKKATQRSLN